ncbi:MAG TPA: outer membrane beta-barrel protein [Acidobacteriaceae bacterium]|jgi:opacity protein-like surface antigen|nr:outer membrane beta-barrel protein [Acidobacteriaceae bacterium]
MQFKSLSSVFFLACILALISTAGAQTDVAASVYGAFSGTTTGNGIQQSPSNSAGALVELRHIANPILGFEATYSFNRNDQTYQYAGNTPLAPGTGTCPVSATTCSNAPVVVPANAHELTLDWTPSLHFANFRPFGVLGAGLLLNVPSNSSVAIPDGNGSTQTSTKPVYVYGAGLDWGFLPHIGLRVQYRGNLYHAPDLTSLTSSSGKFTQTAEPMVGIYFRL